MTQPYTRSQADRHAGRRQQEDLPAQLPRAAPLRRLCRRLVCRPGRRQGRPADPAVGRRQERQCRARAFLLGRRRRHLDAGRAQRQGGRRQRPHRVPDQSSGIRNRGRQYRSRKAAGRALRRAADGDEPDRARPGPGDRQADAGEDVERRFLRRRRLVDPVQRLDHAVDDPSRRRGIRARRATFREAPARGR